MYVKHFAADRMSNISVDEYCECLYGVGQSCDLSPIPFAICIYTLL